MDVLEEEVVVVLVELVETDFLEASREQRSTLVGALDEARKREALNATFDVLVDCRLHCPSGLFDRVEPDDLPVADLRYDAVPNVEWHTLRWHPYRLATASHSQLSFTVSKPTR